MLNVIGCLCAAVELEKAANLHDWIRAPSAVMTALCFFIDPGVLSRFSMDVQGCLCTPVLGDYLLKVIWDQGVPLIIPESIQHLHLLCCIYRSTSKTKGSICRLALTCLQATMLEVAVSGHEVMLSKWLCACYLPQL